MSAVILQMPATVQRKARRRLDRVELDARHSWMIDNYSRWETAETDGVKYPTRGAAWLMTALRKEWGDEFPQLTVEQVRKDISEKRKIIVKRNQAKAWLQSLGADVDNIKTPEEALFFVVDYLQANRG